MTYSIKIGDSVLDEWVEQNGPIRIGIVIDFYTNASTPFPYFIHWNDGNTWEYDENEVLEMKAAYEKYKL